MLDILIALLPTIVETAIIFLMGYVSLWVYDGIVEIGEGND